MQEGLSQNEQFFVPTEPEDPWTGKELRFETTDLDGNPVRSEELFAQHKVTMLNIWATWCGPCKGELRELGDINRRVQEKNGAIIGILSDADDAAIPSRASRCSSAPRPSASSARRTRTARRASTCPRALAMRSIC